MFIVGSIIGSLAVDRAGLIGMPDGCATPLPLSDAKMPRLASVGQLPDFSRNLMWRDASCRLLKLSCHDIHPNSVHDSHINPPSLGVEVLVLNHLVSKS